MDCDAINNIQIYFEFSEDELTKPLEERVIVPTPLPPPPPDEDEDGEEIDIDLEEEDVTQPLPERPYLNLAFFDVTLAWETPRKMSAQEGFWGNRRYRLEIGIFPVPDVYFAQSGSQPVLHRPESEEECITLLVVIHSIAPELNIVGSRRDTLEWPAGAHSTKSAEFTLQTTAVSQSVTVPLHVAAYYRNNQVFAANLFIEIAPERVRTGE